MEDIWVKVVKSPSPIGSARGKSIFRKSLCFYGLYFLEVLTFRNIEELVQRVPAHSHIVSSIFNILQYCGTYYN